MTTPADDLPQLTRALQALQQARARLDAIERARVEPIAVVGLSCRFPGAASPAAFWRMLVEGRDAITEVPAERWDIDAYYDPDVKAVGKTATRWGGFLDGIDQFDPTFFHISPREAARMDPQQRLLLEVSWEALENAGLPRERIAGSATGVYIGVLNHSSEYAWFQFGDPVRVGTYTGTGTAHSILANRISYWLDLRGPSLAVDTACSSSLVAVHMAVQALRTRECDLALAGGVNLLLTPQALITTSKMRMMAADGRCKTFDSRADGFVRAEGCGVVVLKRLADALADGDPILALIAGSAVNQDGATNGLTAPNGLAQQAVVRRALADGKVDPARVGYVETHGTGTALGDPIEVEALTEVLGRAGEAPCVLGAVKTNIGHAESAAGIAGLIKAVLALKHETIPPNLHLREPNPHLSLEGTRFELPATGRPWPAGTDRHAGVSSFGFGGTNAHVILREAPVDLARRDAAGEAAGNGSADAEVRRPFLLPLSARTPHAVRKLVEAYIELLGGSSPPLSDICHTASVRRTHHEHRLAVVGSSPQEMGGALSAFLAGETPADVVTGHADPDARRRLVWVFSGQGSQWPEMGRTLLEREPVFRERLEACDTLLRPLAGWSLLDELAAPAERSRIDETQITQPALFAVQIALAELWRSWGMSADAVVGHSMGEVAAAYVAGALDLEQAIRIIYHRGRVMQRAIGAGRMAAVGLSGSAVQTFLAGRDDVSVAAVNGPTSTVISGAAAAIESAVEELSTRGIFARLLDVSLASHSTHMEPLRGELVRSLAGLSSRPAAIALYSTVTGARAGAGDFDAEYWGRNLREPVLFARAIAAAAESGDVDYLEISPQPMLRTPLEQCADGAGSLITGSLERAADERTALLRSLAALHVRGYAVAWDALQPGGGKVVPLPSYPWQRRRYWLDAGPAAPATAPAKPRVAADPVGDGPFAGRLLASPIIADPIFESRISAASLAFLGEHRMGAETVMPAAGFAELVLAATDAALGRDTHDLAELGIVHPLVLPADAERIVQCIIRSRESEADGRVVGFEVHSRSGEDSGGWILHAAGRLEPGARLPDTASAFDGEALVPLRLDPDRYAARSDRARRAMLLDACFRLLATTALGGDPDGFVVASLGRLRLRTPPDALLLCDLRLDRAEDPDGDLTGAVRLFDEAGTALGTIEGVRFARLRRQAAAAAVRPEAWLHEVVWRPRGVLHRHAHRDPPSGDPTRDGGIRAVPAVVEGWTVAALAPGERGPGAASSALPAALDRLSAAYAAKALRGLGVDLEPGLRIPHEVLGERLGLPLHRRRLLHRIVGMLEEDAVLGRAGRDWDVLRSPEAFDPDAAVEALVGRYPEREVELTLFRRCASRLADVLRDEVDPLQLLFPDGSLEQTEHLYRDSPLSRGPNTLVRQAVEQVVAALPADRVLRILEIGAGTGGTTAHVLPLLPALRTEYVFTDVSRRFVERAAGRFGEYPFVRCELLDIEREPEAQGFAAAQFDVVLAANVLHATADLRDTIARVRRLLRPGGLLLLLEGTRPTRWVDLVFGQTEGWWKFADTDLRAEHPLLDPESWRELLQRDGFARTKSLLPRDPAGEAESSFEQALILAQADAAPRRSTLAAGDGGAAGNWLIVADAAGVGEALAAAIRAEGGDCVVAHRGADLTEADAAGDRADGARGAQPEDITRVVRAWSAAAERPVGVVYLPALDAASERRAATEVHARVSADCARVTALSVALLDLESASRPRLWLVTRGAQPVRDNESADPVQASLWGLGRSVALECPDNWGGLVDLAPGSDPDADAPQILAQLMAGDSEDQVAFREGQRFVARLTPLVGAATGQPDLCRDAAYLVTGGLGVLGLELARWLAERGAGHLVLLGRTGLPPRNAWPGLAPGAPEYAKVAAIREIERLGATVTIVPADVTDAAAMSGLFMRFGTALPRLRGVFHTAAVVDSVPLRRLSSEQLEAVLRPKIQGGWLLHQLTRGAELDYFVLFSSVAGLWGSRGMSHYAAANQFLDALSHYRRNRGLPALSIDWGGWRAGDLSRAGDRFLAKSDLRLMPAESALAMLGAAMAAGVAQRAIAWVDWASLRASYELQRDRPFLTEVGIRVEQDVETVATSAEIRSGLLQRLAALDDDEAFELLTAHVHGEVAQVLGLDAPHALEPSQGFFSVGMDSIMTVELRARLERSIGLRLPTTIAFEYPTVEALTGYLAREVLRRPATTGEGRAPDDAATSAVADPALEDLSERELAEMLDGVVAGLLDDESTTR
jgi:acyl transferase domain-containing protein/protein-L-isoaspartate O-methyltransferase